MDDADAKILLLDQDDLILELTQEILSEAGLQSVRATTLEEAIKTTSEHTLFAAIVDFKTSETSESSFHKHLASQSIELLYIATCGADDLEKAKSLFAGASIDVMEKPLDVESVLPKLKAARDEWLQQSTAEDEQLEEIKEAFLEEAAEILNDIDEFILALEDESQRHGAVDLLFRKMHTIKGGSGAVKGAANIGSLAHAFENVITHIKKADVEPSGDAVSSLLSTADLLKSMLQNLEENRELPDVSKNIEQLVSIIESKTGQEAPTTGASSSDQTSTDADKKVNTTQASPQDQDADEGVLVSNEKLDKFMELAGELVAFKNLFQGVVLGDGTATSATRTQVEDMDKMLSKISDQIQAQIMDVRKVSLHKAFSRFPRTVRTIAKDLGKQIRLTIVGQDIEVDKTIARALGSSLIHVVRNACDHGIESPDERNASGKAPVGQVKIIASESGGITNIVVEDDGRGLSREKIGQSAVKKELVTQANLGRMSDQEVYDLLFLPGFSTAKKVTNVSGRGVGMDVVKTAMINIGGKMQLSSDPGKSTKLALSIPVPKTVIVEQSVVVKSNEVKLAVPLNHIADIRTISRDDFTFVQSGWTIQHRGITIPIATYDRFLLEGRDSRQNCAVEDEELVIAITHKDRYVGLRVQQICDQLEAVVRPFDNVIESIRGFSGLTILADDTIAYVLSAEEMVDAALSKSDYNNVRQAA